MRNITIAALITLLLAACIEIPTADNTNQQTDPDPQTGPDPSTGPDTQPKKLDDQYYRLKPNTGDAFEKSLKTYLTSALSENYYYRGAGVMEFDDGATTTGSAGGTLTGAAPASGNASNSDAATAPNTSGTNLIEKGVDEADLIKSDGEFLYVARNNSNMYYGGPVFFGGGIADAGAAVSTPAGDASIAPYPAKTDIKPHVLVYSLDAATPKATQIATIAMPEDTTYIRGVYLYKDAGATPRLFVLSDVSVSVNNYYSTNTRITAFDVATPESPSQLWTLEITGSSIGTRLLNGKILLITRDYLNLDRVIYANIKRDDRAQLAQAINSVTVADVLPKTKINNENVTLVDAGDCVVPVETNQQSYFDFGLTNILTIPVNNPQAADAVCTLEGTAEIYVSPKSLYMTKNDYIANVGEGTLIHKFALNDSGLAYRASGRIAGTVGWRNNAFRMSEHEDFFRVVTTVYPSYTESGVPFFRAENNETHHLYILKEDKINAGQLTVVSQLPNETKPAAIGKPGEQIYGVRFNGNYGYVVTFKKVDPLYVLNLTDPENPFIEGELELPGYSDYLHPVNENMLIGIGKDAIEENGTTWYQGIKVGVFDISDKTNPQVVSETVIGKRGTESPALHDHHAFAFLENPDTGIIRFAFPVIVHDGTPAYYNGNGASTYYNWQYSGLQLFELARDANNIYSLNDNGVLTAAQTNAGATNSFYFQEPRALLLNDAVFLADTGQTWAANWYTPNMVNTSAIPETVNVVGYLNIVQGGGSAQAIQQAFVSVMETGQNITIEYPDDTLDQFLANNVFVGKQIAVQGTLTSLPGEAPRRIRLTSIVVAE